MTYDWRLDALNSYHLAYRLKAIAKGSVLPASPAEMYWAEMHGVIP